MGWGGRQDAGRLDGGTYGGTLGEMLAESLRIGAEVGNISGKSADSVGLTAHDLLKMGQTRFCTRRKWRI